MDDGQDQKIRERDRLDFMSLMKIFVVEDEEILRISLKDDLEEAGYTVFAFEDPKEALDSFKKQPVDIVISDIKMPGMSGLKLLSGIKAIKAETIVILITAFGSVDSAVEAMKKGAYDYITKPFKMDEILLVLDRAKELHLIKQENIQLRSHFVAKYSVETFIGDDLTTQKILEHVKTIKNRSTTVLITGETGTGKELLANIIHYNSDRKNNPLVKVSCAVLSRDIFESELFGHEKGAFTGASKERIGRFEMANGGTLYLDDVEDIPIDLQVKLLRVLQEQEFERVGGNDTIKVDVRVIASTKVNLMDLIRRGRFREDLYYRLNIFPINLPPLRQRNADIQKLIGHFAGQLAPELDMTLDPQVIDCMNNYHWPGNVREIKNVVERLLLLARGGEINLAHLPPEMTQSEYAIPEISLGQKPLQEMVNEIEANLIYEALQKCHGSQIRAAELLGIPPSTLRTKMKKYKTELEKKMI